MTDTICPLCGSPASPTAHRLGKGDRRCNSCINAASKAYRLRRAAEGRPVRNAWRDQARSAEFLAMDAAAEKRRYHEDPERRRRHLARSKARHAVAIGKLERQPCEVCGATKVQAHHDDYSEPLAVRWLCPTHHHQHHAALRAAA